MSKDGIAFIKDKVQHLPQRPGVYRMYGENGELLYVGKAANLKNRVSQYTQANGLSRRIRQMVYLTRQLEVFETTSEAEALLLEANLIKELKPRYNIRLKDDSSYPSIVITAPVDGGIAPQLRLHRGKKPKNGWCFGPYPSAQSVRQMLDLLEQIFNLRTCSDGFYKARKRPCLKYHIKRCSAPCVGKVSLVEYQHQVEEAVLFLQGKAKHIQQQIQNKMLLAAETEDFELAARQRDRLALLAKNTSSQTVITEGLKDVDVIALLQKADCTVVQIFSYRHGYHVGNLRLFPEQIDELAAADAMQAFLSIYYADKPLPHDLLLNVMPTQKDIVIEVLQQRRGGVVSLAVPKRGQKAEIIKQAESNALAEVARRQSETRQQQQVLAEFATLLELDTKIERIECFDVSNTQGQQPVASMVVAGGEGMVKNQSRKFAVKSKNTPDDYAMMREILTRRYGRLLKENPDGANWPQVIMVDGGKGHLRVLVEVFATLNIDPSAYGVALCAIAKGKERDKGLERIFIPNKPQPLAVEYNSPLIFMLQRIRDESHRVAIGYHRLKRAKNLVKSELDEIAGIGSKRKKALLHHFGSVAQIKKASIIDLAQVEGISSTLAQQIYNFFAE